MRSRGRLSIEELRRQREEELMKECTFKPQTLTPSSRAPRGASASASNRLYEEAAKRKQRLESTQRALREAEISSYSFKPRLNAASEALVGGLAHKPLQDRIADIQRARDEKLSRMKLSQELANPNLTFHPRVATRGDVTGSDVSMDSAALSVSERVTRRLSLEAVEAHRRHIERQRKWQEEQEALLPFKPKTSQHSKHLIARRNPELADATFLERQQMFETEKRKKVEEMASLEMAECTFHPETYNADEVLIRLRPSMLGETEAERFARLSYDDSERVNRARDTVRDKYYSQFSYRPEINDQSKVLVRGNWVEELAHNDASITSRARIAAEQEERFKSQHTFTPALTSKPMSVDRAPLVLAAATDPDSVSDRIQAYLKSREEKLAAARREKEYEELKACTFMPVLPRSEVKQPEGPVVVRGLGRFMETKELARKLEEEQRVREQNAFSVRLPKREPGAPIVPEPFHLSCDARIASRHADAAHAIQAQNLKECTFHPQTSEGRNRELLMMLLANDDA